MTYDAIDASGNAAVQLTRTVTVADTTPPVLTLNGAAVITLECSIDGYAELGASVSDACDPNVTVLIGGDVVDVTMNGVYLVTYDATDSSGNAAVQITRTVKVVDTTAPVITLNGAVTMTLECSIDGYAELGASVSDACDPNVTVTIGGDVVDVTVNGTYTVTYDATDASGNTAVQLTRTVTVVDTTPPVITLVGDDPQLIECPDPYLELGATASDLSDGNLTAQIVIDDSAVDTTVPASAVVSYTVEDTSGNSTTVTREVEAVDTTSPIITLTGDSEIVLLQGDAYQEEGAIVTDTSDQNVTVVIGGDVVDTSIVGDYVVTYDSADSSGNVATQVSRLVTVLPRFAALSALFGCLDLKAEQGVLVNGSVGSTHSVDLHSQSEVLGDVVSVAGKVALKSNAVVGGYIDAGGQVSVDKDASVGANVISGVKIDLKKNASIGGDATSGGQVKLAKGASVDGAVTENVAVLPLTDIPLPVLALTTSGSNVTVKKNESVSVLPGAYTKLKAKEASTIGLSSGNYTFSELDVDKYSVIELDASAGPIMVDVVGNLDFDGVGMMLIGGDVTDVLFQVQGDHVKLGTINVGGKSDANEKIGYYVGTYLAPNAHLTLEEGGVLHGTAYALEVQLKQDSLVNPQPALDLLVAASAGWVGMESCIEAGGGSTGESGSSGSSKGSGSSGSGTSESGKSGGSGKASDNGKSAKGGKKNR